MSAQTILWVDLRSVRSEPDLCSSLTSVYKTTRLQRLSHLLHALKRWRPWALCVEFDLPDPRALEALLDVKTRDASLPIIMLAATHTKTLDDRAFRRCAWQYLVKPVSVGHLRECLASIRKSESPPSIAVDVGTTRTVAPAVSYVWTNYSHKLSLSTAAKLCDQSRFQFSRNFKRSQGQTFRDFVVDVRVNRAAALMRRSVPPSITEAAFVVGFNDLSHFSRMFRRKFGVTPSQYRRTEGEPIQLSLFTDEPLKKL